ncbi:G patch domain-containing protein 3 [Carcharodon carcharias]|uniref:G patch domain-containing protein 3 n=1 Tax=Carcharodon carcharias TaxID=13397 RepID=UPI001B7EA67C|nr:G patch domain-containing protein 3 [Carcharodon carcharias]
MEARDCVYAVVGNIPRSLRSADLRNQFSQFTESGGFSCFHYRHRPEWRRPFPTPAPASELEPGRSPTCCCVVRLPADRASSFLLMYDGCQWVDRAGDSLRSRCFIRIVRATEIADSNLFSYKTRKELRSQRAQSETFTPEDLSRLPELNPPILMPNGNVGTPLKVFLELIQACRLPPRIITKLSLKFPKTSSSRRYGNVPFQYQDSAPVYSGETVYTASGEEIPQGDMTAPTLRPGKEQRSAGHRKSLKRRDEEEEGETSHSDDDNDTCEEWERHEALYEDVTTQERTKERLYEEEIELKWEKGGSGLVFYTDAQYWQEEKGDFDEETADDWDVDMSVYYDKDGGDKDSRDYMQMRLEQRQREGIESVSVQSPRIGGFERYTKGIGRKVMEKQGWKEGQGLGSSSSGLADALDNDGQNPKCKRGFGYHGERIQNFQPVKKACRQTKHLISTVYDQPEEMDQGDTLLRRQPVISMKYREDMKFVKGSELSNHTQLPR